MIYSEAGFLAVVLFGSSPSPFPPLPVATSLSQSSYESPVELTDGRGVGEEPNYTIARSLFKSFNTSTF
jgi:hypothetical protein